MSNSIKHPTKIKSVIYSKYFQDTNLKYINQTLTNILESKNTHLVVVLKESMIYDYPEEFLKRYYKRKESVDKVPKFVNYYKNYGMFFCKPVFVYDKYNSIIQNNGEKLAEIYYKANYARKAVNDDKKTAQNAKAIFSESIKEDINKVSTDENNESKATIVLNRSNFVLMNRYKSNDDNENQDNFFDVTESASQSGKNILQGLGGKRNSVNRLNNKKVSSDSEQNVNILTTRIDSKQETITPANRFYLKTHENSAKDRVSSTRANGNNVNINETKTIKLSGKLKYTPLSLKPINILKQSTNNFQEKPQDTNTNKVQVKPTHIKNVGSTQINPTKILLTDNNVITLASHDKYSDRGSKDLSSNKNRNFNTTQKNYRKSNYSLKSSSITHTQTTTSSKQGNTEGGKLCSMLDYKSKITTRLNKGASRNKCEIYPGGTENTKLGDKGKNKLFSSYNNFESQQKILNINRKLTFAQGVGNKATNRTGSSIAQINIKSTKGTNSKLIGIKLKPDVKGIKISKFK